MNSYMYMAHLLSHENEHELCLFGRLLGNVIHGPICSENDQHFCTRFKRNLNSSLPLGQVALKFVALGKSYM